MRSEGRRRCGVVKLCGLAGAKNPLEGFDSLTACKDGSEHGKARREGTALQHEACFTTGSK
jgi:hypothetical protein